MKKPVIGITVAHCSEELVTFPREFYVSAIRRAGGMPILLPPAQSGEEGRELLSLLDGLVLSGGGDVSPYLIEQVPLQGIGTCIPERDSGELMITQEALGLNIPILGICRGCQIIAMAAGGTVLQDIQTATKLQHAQKAPRSAFWHKVRLEESRLLQMIDAKEIGVNSFHHQAVSQLPPGFIVNAMAPDGMIEGIERQGGSLCLGVQWHPESLEKDSYSRRIFRGFVQACQAHKN